MITQIKTWGNSQAIRIPRDMIREAGFQPDEDLDIEVENGRLIISKAHRHMTLNERIQKYGPIQSFPEMDWGEPVGSERW